MKQSPPRERKLALLFPGQGSQHAGMGRRVAEAWPGAREVFSDASDVLHIDCTADGLGQRPATPVFDGDRITVQNVRTCQPAFSAAFVGHVEAAYDDETVKNELCTPIPYPSRDIDWLKMTLQNTLNLDRWNADPALAAWMRESRLDVYTSVPPDNPPTPAQMQIVGKLGTYRAAAVENLRRLLGEG